MIEPTRTIAEYRGLRRAVARAARGRRTIGFDVFDTLLHRRVEPETVKDLVAKRMARLLAGVATHVPLTTPGIPDWRLLRERRRQLELDLGHEADRFGHDHEFRLRPMMRRWVEECGHPGASPGLPDQLVTAELQFEHAATFPARGIVDVLEAASEAGQRRLIWVSDSYLDVADIWDLLRRHGLARHFEAGYASSSTLRTKRSGRLFEYVLRRELLQPHEFLFVGDNPHSDVASPRRLDIATVHVRDAIEARRRTRMQVLDRSAADNPFFVGAQVREIVETAPRHLRESRCPHYRLGISLAPALLAFTLHILEEAQARDLRRLYFFAREGLTFLRMYRRLVRRLGIAHESPPAHYLGISRAATFLASMEALNCAELDRMWVQYSRQSIGRLALNLTLPLDEIRPAAERHGLADLESPIENPHTDTRFQAFIADADVQRCFVRRRDESRDLLRDYLRAKQFFDVPRVGIIDIGWKGSIQSNLFRSVRALPECPSIEGLYLGLAHPIADDDARSTRHGYLADTRRGDWLQDVVFKNGPAFEMVTTAPHGSTTGYRRAAGGRVKPVIRMEDTESRNFRSHFASIFRGIEDYLREFLDAAPLIDASSADLRAHVLDQIRRYILYPTRAEARAFLQYSHVENFGVFKVSTYEFKGSWRDILTRGSPLGIPGRLIGTLRTQFWPEAMLRRWRIPGANFLYDLLETRRASRWVPP